MGTRHTHRRVSDADACQTTVTLLWATRRGEPSSKPELICKAARGELWGKRATRQRKGGGRGGMSTLNCLILPHSVHIWHLRFWRTSCTSVVASACACAAACAAWLKFWQPASPRVSHEIYQYVSESSYVCLSVCLSVAAYVRLLSSKFCVPAKWNMVGS